MLLFLVYTGENERPDAIERPPPGKEHEIERPCPGKEPEIERPPPGKEHPM